MCGLYILKNSYIHTRVVKLDTRIFSIDDINMNMHTINEGVIENTKCI